MQPHNNIAFAWSLTQTYSLRTGTAKATFFQDNRYIRALNQALRAEYSLREWCCDDDLPEDLQDIFLAILPNHDRAIQTLKRLIIALRGLPVEPSADLGHEISRVAFRMVALVPSSFSTKAQLKAFLQAERNLIRRYQALIKVAPNQEQREALRDICSTHRTALAFYAPIR